MELIDSRQLRAFQLLARTGSFTEAAQQMFLTQSAVSHSIKALETSLDTRLLDRSGRKMALTAAGESLLRHADRIISEMQEANDELEALSRWGAGRLRIGATDTMCQHLLPPALQEFRESHARCDVRIRSADTGQILRDLAQGEIDLAIGISSDSTPTGLEFHPLFQDQLVFAVPPLHPWAVDGIDTSIEALQKESYIIYARKSPTSRLVEASFRQIGLHSPRFTELGNMEAIRELAKIGMGVAVLAPWLIKSDLEQGLLATVSPPGEPIHREWGFFTRKNSNLTMTGEAFLGICRGVAERFSNKKEPASQLKVGSGPTNTTSG